MEVNTFGSIKRHFSIILILLVNLVHSQSSGIFEHRGVETASNFIKENGKYYYLTRSTMPGSCCYDSMAFVCRNQNGNLVFRTHFIVSPQVSRFFIRKSGARFVLYAETEIADCQFAANKSFLGGGDTSGVVTWTLTNNFPAALDILPSVGNGFTLWTPNKVLEYNASGQLLNMQTLAVSGLRAVNNYSAGAIVASGAGAAGYFLCILGSGYQTVKSASVSDGYDKLVTSSDDGVIASNAFRISKFSNSLELLHDVTLGWVETVDMVTRNDSVFASINNFGNSQYWLLDSSFATQHTCNVQFQVVNCSGISVEKGKIQLMCNFNSKCAAILETNLKGNLTGIEDIELRNVFIGVSTLNPVFGSSLYELVVNATATVINNGPDTVSTFKLHQITPNGMCTFGLDLKFDVSIQPGGFTIIQTPTFVANRDNFSSDIQSICFYVTGPNERPHKKSGVDGFCAAARIPLDLLKINNSNYVQVSPVPVSDVLAVQSANTIRTVQLTDINGKLLINEYPNIEKFELNVVDLLPGMYFLKVNGDYSVFQTKVIKN